MSGSTTELNLRTAVDSDDNADYLTLDLANSLRTLDALFNNVTGHNHSSAHQGGPLVIGAAQIADGSINSAKIADGSIQTVDLADGSVTTPKLADHSVSSVKLLPPIDIPEYFRSTNVQSYPNTGSGLELYYQPGNGAVVQSYNRGGSVYLPLLLIGSTVTLMIGGAAGLTVNADRSINTGGALTLGVGTINLNAGMAITNDGNNIFYRSTAPGNHFFQHTDGSYAGVLCSTITATGTLSAPSITFNQSGYYWQGIAGIGALETNGGIQVDGGLIYFHSNRTVYLQLSGTQLNIAGFTQVNQPGTNVTGALAVIDPGGNINQITFDNNAGSPQPGGSQRYRVIAASTRSAATYGDGEIHMGLRLYVDGDITAGTYVHGISFVNTSDPNAKSNATIFSDDACMTRVRSTLPVYTYEIPPAVEGGIEPTVTDIGFMAPDVYATNPEFAALDPGGQAVGVTYSNMAALLWGALRQLDARCTAKGI